MKMINVFIVLTVLVTALSQISHATAAGNTAECSISIDKESYELGEKVSFKPVVSRPDEPDAPDTLDALQIQYWVEYKNGTIVKKAVNTSSITKKSFTPKKEATYIIRMVAGNYCNASEEIRVGNPASVSEISESTENSAGGPSQNIELSISVRDPDRESGGSSASSKYKSSNKDSQTVQQAKPKSKAASLVIWFLLFLLTVFCVVLIWRR